MPLMRIAVCFEGRIITHDHIFSDPLRPRPPRVLAIPHLPYSYLSLLCHSCFYSRFLLPSFFPLFISSPCSFPPCTCSLISLLFAPTQQRLVLSQNHTQFHTSIALPRPSHYAFSTNHSTSFIPQFSPSPHSPHDTVLSRSRTNTSSHIFPLSCFPIQHTTPAALGFKYPLQLLKL